MNVSSLGPLELFGSYIGNDENKRQYITRLGYFFDFLELPGNTEKQAACFINQAKTDPQWSFGCIISFVNHYKRKVANGEISATTLTGYFNAIQGFYEANDMQQNWKRIRKGLPRPMLVADDRAPTIDEIRNLCEYPDRRIKPIVYTMCSSGIRIGAWDFLKWKHITPPLFGPKWETSNNCSQDRRVCWLT
jgi:hypothetical protein